MSKKILAAFCAVLMTMGLMCSCSENPGEESSSKAEESSAAESPQEIEDAPEDDKDEETTDEETTDDETTSEESTVTPAMWQVTGENGAVVTFVGSMHALKESDYPMPAKMIDAFEGSDILAVEADLAAGESISFQSSLLASMYYEDPTDRLSNHISEEGYDALDNFLKDFGMTAEQFELFRPWAVDNTVENLPIAESGLSAEYGIDAYFMDLARESDKEIYEVEGMDFQMDLLINFSDEIYDLMFRSLGDENKDSYIKLLNDTHDAWLHGDLDAMSELEESDSELSEEDEAIYEEYSAAMIYDRNEGMAEAAKEFIDGDTNVFFIVGAAHFTGEKGIIALLENEGYEIERIEY